MQLKLPEACILGKVAHQIFNIQHEQPFKREIHCIIMEETQDALLLTHQKIVNKLKEKFNTFTLQELKQ